MFNIFKQSTLEVYVIVDCHSYAETLSLIDDIAPDEVMLRWKVTFCFLQNCLTFQKKKQILLHDGNKNNVLSKKIDAEMKDKSRILYISRQYFDQDRGSELLSKVIVGKVDADLVAKYVHRYNNLRNLYII